MTNEEIGRRERRRIRLLLAAGLTGLSMVLLASFQLSRAGPTFHGTTYDDAPPAPEYALVDHLGNPARLADERGRAVLLFFGFTRCPDVCPLTLHALSAALEELDDRIEDVRVLLITVDPEHDTPDRLASYVAQFGPGVTGLTGSAAEIQRVMADYGAYARADGESVGGTAPSIVHSTVVFGIDRDGRLRVLIHGDQPLEVLRDDIEVLAAIRG